MTLSQPISFFFSINYYGFTDWFSEGLSLVMSMLKKDHLEQVVLSGVLSLS